MSCNLFLLTHTVVFVLLKSSLEENVIVTTGTERGTSSETEIEKEVEKIVIAVPAGAEEPKTSVRGN